MSKKRNTSENDQWLAQETLRRAEVARRLASQRRPLDGFSVIRLPSLADVLDEIQPPATRYAGGEA